MVEATVGLDAGSRQQLLATVRNLVDANLVAVLWATHLMEKIEVTDRLLFLQKGTLRGRSKRTGIDEAPCTQRLRQCSAQTNRPTGR